MSDSSEREPGRPSHEPSKASRDLVTLHKAIGTPQETIALLLEIDAKTLRKHYRAELDTGKARMIGAVGGKLFKAAMGSPVYDSAGKKVGETKGDITAQIFIMKTQGGWKTATALELSGPGGGPVKHINKEMTPEEAQQAYAATLAGAVPDTEDDDK